MVGAACFQDFMRTSLSAPKRPSLGRPTSVSVRPELVAALHAPPRHVDFSASTVASARPGAQGPPALCAARQGGPAQIRPRRIGKTAPQARKALTAGKVKKRQVSAARLRSQCVTLAKPVRRGSFSAGLAPFAVAFRPFSPRCGGVGALLRGLADPRQRCRLDCQIAARESALRPANRARPPQKNFPVGRPEKARLRGRGSPRHRPKSSHRLARSAEAS